MMQEIINLIEQPSYRNIFSLKDPTEEDIINIENGIPDEFDKKIELDQRNKDDFEFYQVYSN